MHEMSYTTESGTGRVTNQTTSTKHAGTNKPTPADLKMKKKMSGLRRTIRAIFRAKEKRVPDVSPTESRVPSPEIRPARLEKEVHVDEDVTIATKSDAHSSSASSQCSSPSSSMPTPSSSKSLETSVLSSALTPTIRSPEEPSSAPDARATFCLPKPPSPDKVPVHAKKSGFYMYNGQPSYRGSRLYQWSDLEPETDILGQWVELGSGETGTTRLVRISSGNGKLVAAKILRGQDPEAKFHKEVDALHIVGGHPSFPQLIGVVEQSPFRCILEEFIGNDFIPENTTLEDVLRSNKISASEIPQGDWLQIAQDVADGILYLHRLDYLHLNIRPENILLYATEGSWSGWRAKLVDLGDCTFARLAPNIHATPEIRAAAQEVSTPFVAPEVLSGETPHTMAADVYALGRVLCDIGKATKTSSLQQIGKKCSRRKALKRPDMDRVCGMLSWAATF